MTPVVTLYSRPGCHLCDEARATLLRLRARARFELEEVDITADDDLHARYLERIPVIAVGGRELSDFFVDEPAVLEALSRDPPIPAGPRHRGRSPETIGRNPRWPTT